MSQQRTLAALQNVFLGIDLVRVNICDFGQAVAEDILQFCPPITAFMCFPKLEKCVWQAFVHRPPVEELITEILENRLAVHVVIELGVELRGFERKFAVCDQQLADPVQQMFRINGCHDAHSHHWRTYIHYHEWPGVGVDTAMQYT